MTHRLPKKLVSRAPINMIKALIRIVDLSTPVIRYIGLFSGKNGDRKRTSCKKAKIAAVMIPITETVCLNESTTGFFIYNTFRKYTNFVANHRQYISGI
jgi:hypothetical protein